MQSASRRLIASLSVGTTSPRRYSLLKTAGQSSKSPSVMRLRLAASTFLVGSASSFSITTSTTSTSMDQAGALAGIQFDNSWIAQLSPESPANLKRSLEQVGLRGPEHDNRKKRPVFNGHYVLVKPTGLPDPQLILVSEDVAEQLKLSPQDVMSTDFTNFVSGNLHLGDSWATPYALSINGNRYTSNCPFGTGDGYGDGRAISIGEFQGLELQLKGAGTTPFCRGGDGRAVLRSSIREFLASEAMHHLGVSTTRALSLVVSQSETVARPWYSPNASLQVPTMDDSRLSKYTQEQRREIIMQLRNEKLDPNLMIMEPCAITCRVSKSFSRIGHVDLFARRAIKKSDLKLTNSLTEETNSGYDTTTNEWKELEDMIWHVAFREFRTGAYDPFIKTKDIAGAATVLLYQSADRISTMVAEWIRVGFCQGNFNADNCLIGGHTMDYGPFGFMEEYFPLFAKWTGSGEHFGFKNQPTAGFANYKVLVESVVPVICAATNNKSGELKLMDEFLVEAKYMFDAKTDQVFRNKMGFEIDMEVADSLLQSLDPLMIKSRVDWTLFWRQLTCIARDFEDYESTDYEAMLETLISDGDTSPFYEPLTPEHRAKYLEWIKDWREMLVEQDDVAERMRMANPKYVLREWMMVEAYKNAEAGNTETIQDLYELMKAPYEEGTALQQDLYYRRASPHDLTKAGTAFFSCSS